MGMTTLLRTILSIAVAVTFFGAATSAMDEEDPWQQEKAAKLARKLAEQTSDLRLTMKRAAPGTMGIARQKKFALEEDLRLIRSTSKHLANQLKAGKGRDETLPTARRIGMFIRDARVDAYGWTPSEGLETKVDAARATLGELAALYGATLQDVFRNTPGVGADQ